MKHSFNYCIGKGINETQEKQNIARSSKSSKNPKKHKQEGVIYKSFKFYKKNDQFP